MPKILQTLFRTWCSRVAVTELQNNEFFHPNKIVIGPSLEVGDNTTLKRKQTKVGGHSYWNICIATKEQVNTFMYGYDQIGDLTTTVV